MYGAASPSCHSLLNAYGGACIVPKLAYDALDRLEIEASKHVQI